MHLIYNGHSFLLSLKYILCHFSLKTNTKYLACMEHWTTKLSGFGSGSLSKARVLKAQSSMVFRACHWKHGLEGNSETSNPPSCCLISARSWEARLHCMLPRNRHHPTTDPKAVLHMTMNLNL